MTRIGEDDSARNDVQHLDHFIIATEGKISAVRRPGDGINAKGGITVEQDDFPIGGIPDVHGLVVADRGNTLAIT